MIPAIRPALLPLVVFTAACSAVGVALLKAGMNGAGVAWLPLAAGIALYGIGLASGVVLLARHPLSVAYPAVVGLALGILAVISAAWLDEPMSIPKVAGTALIVGGVWLLVRENGAARP